MSEALENEFLNRLFTALRKDELVLPTLPEMALKIRDIVSDPERSLGDVARAVVKDPALSARVIQIANSPVLGARSRIESVEMAVMRMGGAMIRNIVTALVMEQLFQATTEITDRKLRACWKHASEVSTIAMAISHQHTHLQADQAMLAGLIHDIGVLPVLTLAEEYPALLRDEQKLDRLVERAHTELGEAILRHWNFPDSLVKVAAQHENLDYDSGARPDYVDLIIVANLQSAKNKGKLESAGNLAAIPSFTKLGLADGFDSIDMEVAAGF